MRHSVAEAMFVVAFQAGVAMAGEAWSDDELDLIVGDYFDMLAAEQAGRRYVKTRHAERLVSLTGRTRGSVDFKHMNISAVLDELGEPIITGYRPMANYQGAILAAIERRLDRVAANGTDAPDPGRAARPLSGLEPAPRVGPVRPRAEGIERLVRKFDPAERDFRNRELGRAGEEAVLGFERWRLQAAGRPDLADRVQWTAQERGDGAGYDIRSFEPDGGELLLEVKTTRGGATTPFFLSRNEHQVSQERMDVYRLRRVHSFGRRPRMFELRAPLCDSVRLSLHTYQATFN